MQWARMPVGRSGASSTPHGTCDWDQILGLPVCMKCLHIIRGGGCGKGNPAKLKMALIGTLCPIHRTWSVPVGEVQARQTGFLSQRIGPVQIRTRIACRFSLGSGTYEIYSAASSYAWAGSTMRLWSTCSSHDLASVTPKIALSRHAAISGPSSMNGTTVHGQRSDPSSMMLVFAGEVFGYSPTVGDEDGGLGFIIEPPTLAETYYGGRGSVHTRGRHESYS